MYDIYACARNDKRRYTLGKSGAKPLLAIGLNPSTANQEKADTTVAKVERVASQNGFDGFIMLNLYPIRATDFHRLPAKVNPSAFAENLDAIEEVVADQSKPMVWAAWGDSVEYHSYFIDARDTLVQRLAKFNVNWLHFGELTAKGHPRHPSRLAYDWKFSPYKP